MMKRTFKHAISKSSLLVFSSLVLTGCFDVNYETKEEYYDLFSNSVYVYKSSSDGLSSSRETRSLEDDFFNDDSVNDVSKAKIINPDYYEYLAVKPTSNVVMDDFAIYIRTDKASKFALRIFMIDELPDVNKVRSFELGTTEGELPITYDDDYTDPIHSRMVVTKVNEWESVYVDSWDDGETQNRYVEIDASKYLLVQFLNNTGYGKDLGYEPVQFSPVNLIISPKRDNV